ncbi:hypothetical protein BD324DRAFT_654233 [Kockovaella imperatae]|uniref:Uncharacterized protein n=1 Tax=Kockovaella imperatae TaxID=4999 RepID=A0A1Y1U762_9TREE|nr:hypothetical protein BD324DRAFT_654233 [Kockovaella imperatae]ORX33337.1 hypothetical protein BD324DRAFT_654233 [Kockovaella imperatae]
MPAPRCSTWSAPFPAFISSLPPDHPLVSLFDRIVDDIPVSDRPSWSPHNTYDHRVSPTGPENVGFWAALCADHLDRDEVTRRGIGDWFLESELDPDGEVSRWMKYELGLTLVSRDSHPTSFHVCRTLPMSLWPINRSEVEMAIRTMLHQPSPATLADAVRVKLGYMDEREEQQIAPGEGPSSSGGLGAPPLLPGTEDSGMMPLDFDTAPGEDQVVVTNDRFMDDSIEMGRRDSLSFEEDISPYSADARQDRTPRLEPASLESLTYVPDMDPVRSLSGINIVRIELRSQALNSPREAPNVEH